MNKIDINDKNAALAASRSASWRRGILIVKKFANIFFVLLISAACQVKSPSTNTQKPINRHATTLPENTIGNAYDQIIFVGNQKLNVQIVTSAIDMQKGLSGRDKLNDNEGMLFDFKTLGRPNFWMKDMNFNLDLIWIANKKVIGITSNVPAPVNSQLLIVNDSLPTYSPPEDVDMVLEVNAGWSRESEIKIGDEVKTN